MSDQQDKNTEQLAQETAASGESLAVTPAGKDHPDTTAPTASGTAAAKKTSKGGSSAPGWIALLLVLALTAGLAWLLREQQGKDAGIAARLQAIETEAGAEVTGSDLDQLDTRWQGQLGTALSSINADTEELERQSGQLSQSLGTLQEQLSQQQAELSSYSARDRDDWLLAEAQYLLRMANQRLIMADDVAAAQALLGSADKILLELDDVRLHEVRAAVASDLAAVRAVPRVDVEGVYLRLAALIEQAGKLVIFQLPEQAVAARATARRHLAGAYAPGLRSGADQVVRLHHYPPPRCAHAGADGSPVGGPGAAKPAHVAGAGPGGPAVGQ